MEPQLKKFIIHFTSWKNKYYANAAAHNESLGIFKDKLTMDPRSETETRRIAVDADFACDLERRLRHAYALIGKLRADSECGDFDKDDLENRLDELERTLDPQTSAEQLSANDKVLAPPVAGGSEKPLVGSL